MDAAVALYDAFDDYDRFVDWEARLRLELPFLQSMLERAGAQRVIDVACGTGQHAIALARAGWRMTAVDISPEMIARTRANAARADVLLDAHVLAFGGLAPALGGGYDALLCLGNSLPHVITEEEMRATLADWRSILRPGGVAIVQSRNLERVVARGERFMAPEVWRGDGEERIYFRFYNLDAAPRLAFHVLRLQRCGDGPWAMHMEQAPLRAWSQDELGTQCKTVGLAVRETHGNMQGDAFEAETSGDLVLVIERPD